MKRAVVAALALLMCSARANADASIWERAKSPVPTGFLSADELHRYVARLHQQSLLEKTNNPLGGGGAYASLQNARAVLERHEAAKSNDPRLRYDLGLVLARLPSCTEAAPVLEAALQLAPAHPFAEEGAFELAICYSRVGKHADEERAYLLAIDATDRWAHRAIIFSNLSESRMAQGKLESATAAAEQSITLAPDFASPRFNLAIIRDRAGDAFGALESARQAVALDPDGDLLDGEGVFYEPPYERHWYFALRNLALAEGAVADERTGLLIAALVQYQKWLDLAEPTDRYRVRAAENIARLEKQLKLKSAKPAPR
jgi:tetratricopeptide (TPR) repeat protein